MCAPSTCCLGCGSNGRGRIAAGTASWSSYSFLARDGRIEPPRAPLSTKERRLGLVEAKAKRLP
jgi:hypothetical protein